MIYKIPAGNARTGARLLLSALLFCGLLFHGYASYAEEKSPAPRADAIPAVAPASAPAATDYSNKNNWLLYESDGNKGVDIFVVYPTVTLSRDEADKPFVRLDSELMRKNARHWLDGLTNLANPEGPEGILEAGNIYAPLYRQLNAIHLAHGQNLEPLTAALPRRDVFAAFDYYLRNVNRGERPFILFGHSQGGRLVAEIASAFLGDQANSGHNKNHIATYAIGAPVTESGIAHNPALKFARGRDDTGVIISWNTTAPGEIASGSYKRFVTWNPDALTINPVSWTTDETLAHAAGNKGAKLPQPDGSYTVVDSYANALVDNEHRVLVTFTVEESGHGRIDMAALGKFHGLDITLFYGSIRQNLKDRIQAFSIRAF